MKNIIDALNWRYATKMFDPAKKISEEDLNILLQSLQLSPSSFGLQPWKFVVIENPELRTKLKEHSWNQSQITDASHLLVLCHNKNVSAEDIEKYIKKASEVRGVDLSVLDGYKNMMMGSLVNSRSEQQLRDWSKNQVYIASGFLMTVAAQIGIDVCPIEGFDSSKYDEILGLDKMGISSALICAVGYRSSEDKYASAPKIRYEIEDVVIRM